MNALLVYPEYPDTFWSFKHVLRFISKKAAFPPLGLLTIGGMLPKEWDKKLVDTNVKELTDEHIAWADIVFISAMIVQRDRAQEIINRCKSQGKKVVVGGPVFTTGHEKFENVDHFILNEAEITLPLFIKDLEEGNTKQVYTSIEKPDVKKTTLPLWSLIDSRDYSTMMVQYSRGCPYNCEFCDIIIMNGRIPRAKAPEQLLNELQALYDVGWRGGVFIVDDNFIGNTLNVKRMLPHLVEWQKSHKYPFKLLTEASTNLADDQELMKLMSAANFYKVFLGIETPCEESLKETGKLQNVNRDLAETVRIIQQNGMQVMGGFIVGFDSDKESIFETQIDFIQRIGVVTAMVGLLTALPQTRLWHRLKAEGRLVSETTGGNTDIHLNFVPKMSKEKLIEGYKKIISTIYSRKCYYQRIHTFIKNYNPTVRARLSMSEIRAFIKSIWKIGILSKARLPFWKLIIKTSFTKIRALPAAVELAIFGQHFEKIAKKVVPS